MLKGIAKEVKANMPFIFSSFRFGDKKRKQAGREHIQVFPNESGMVDVGVTFLFISVCHLKLDDSKSYDLKQN